MNNIEDLKKHKWEVVGFWDGKDPQTGQRTGGRVLKCVDCEEKANVTYPELHELAAAGVIVDKTE